MLNRVIKVGFVSVLSTVIAGFGVAHAQDEAPVEGDTTTDADGDGMPDAPPAEGDAMPAEGDGMAAEGDAMAEGDGGGKHGLRKGGIAIHASLEVGMSKDSGGDPISIAPDVWYGVSDKLAVGLTHSAYGTTGFWTGQGNSLCVAGDFCKNADGDTEFYDNGGVQAKFGFMQSADMSIAAVGGLMYNVPDPFRMGLRAGIDGMWHSGKIGVAFTPSIQIGLNERDAGNKETLNVPVALMYMASPQLHVGLQTGIRGPLDGFGDAYSVPVGVGAMFMVNPNINVGGAFTLERVAGFDGPGAADLRSLALFVGWKN
jgi:hypothetical protein